MLKVNYENLVRGKCADSEVKWESERFSDKECISWLYTKACGLSLEVVHNNRVH